MIAQPTIESMAATVDLLRLTILMHMDELRRAQTIARIKERDNAS